MNQSIKTILNTVIAAAIIGAGSNLFFLNVHQAQTTERIMGLEKQVSALVSQLQTKSALTYKSP